MGQMTPTQMRTAFQLWEVDIREYHGWETRGYGPGSISDPQGVLIHHTGSDSQSDAYLQFLAVDGRPDVPPPLCNWSTDMDGDLWLIAAEKANHAGEGSSATLNRVKAHSYDWKNSELSPGPDDINGNTKYYGNEVRFDGGQPMTAAQWRTVILSSAAVCDFHGWGAWRVIGHREHTRRKPDPGSTLMYMIRRDVAAALAAGPGNWPVPTKEWDEMATKQEVQDAAYAANALYGKNFWTAPGGTGTALLKTVASQGTAIAELAKFVKADDAADDAAFAAAMAQIGTAHGELMSAVEALAGPKA